MSDNFNSCISNSMVPYSMNNVLTSETKAGYRCDDCGKEFTHYNNLTMHKKMHVTDEQLKCELCNRTFIRKGDRKKHMRVHSGEKPYKCIQCGRCFSQSSNMRKHLRLMHPGSEDYQRSFIYLDNFETFDQVSSQQRSSLDHSADTPQQRSSCNPSVDTPQLRGSRDLCVDTPQQRDSKDLSVNTPSEETLENDLTFSETEILPAHSSQQHHLLHNESNPSKNTLFKPSELTSKYINDVNYPTNDYDNDNESMSSKAIRSLHNVVDKIVSNKNYTFVSHRGQSTENQTQLPNNTIKENNSFVNQCEQLVEEQNQLPANKINESHTIISHHDQSLEKTQVSHKLDESFIRMTKCNSNHLKFNDGQLTCHLCGKQFTRNGDMKKHMRVHSGEKPYACHQCGKRFSQCSNMRKHCKLIHGNNESVNNQYAPQNDDLNFVIPSRSLDDTNDLSVKESSKLHPYSHNKPFTNFLSKNENLGNVYSGDGCYKCNICHKMFVRSGDLKKHLRVHSGEKPYQCLQCGKRFSQNSNMRKHCKLIHKKDKSFQQSDPNNEEDKFGSIVQTFLQQSNIHNVADDVVDLTELRDNTCDTIKSSSNDSTNSIIDKESGFNLNQLIDPIVTSTVTENPEICSSYGVTYTPNHQIDSLSKTIDSSKYIKQDEMELNIPSSEVDFSMTSKEGHPPIDNITTINDKTDVTSEIREVRATSNKDFECRICGRKFNRAGDRNKHMRVHSGEKPYQCLSCGRRFSQNSNMRKHIKLMHQMQSRCDKRNVGYSKMSLDLNVENDSSHDHKNIPLTMESNINSNQITNDLSGKLFQCNICRKQFRRSGDYTKHMRVHSGEKPYQCNDCGKKFSQNSNMRKHMRMHNIKNKYKNYEFHSQKLNTNTENFSSLSATRMTFGQNNLFTNIRSIKGFNKKLVEETDKIISNKKHVDDTPLVAQQVKITKHSPFKAPSNETDMTPNSINDTQHNNKHFICNICSKQFIRAGDYKKHMRVHTGEKPYICPKCGKRFSQNSNMRKHCKMHDMRRMFKNSLNKLPVDYKQVACEYKYSNEINSENNGNSSLINAETVKPVLGCKPSGTVYSKDVVESHGTSIHNESNFQSSIEDRGKENKSSELSNHPKEIYNEDAANNHFLFYESIDSDVSSNPTEKVFIQTQIAINNLEQKFYDSNATVEDKTISHPVDQMVSNCNKSLSITHPRTMIKNIINFDVEEKVHDENNFFIKRDEQSGYNNDKLYDCGICGKQFTRSGDHKKHMRVHSGEKPYECIICGKKFSQNSNMKKHMRLLHNSI